MNPRRAIVALLPDSVIGRARAVRKRWWIRRGRQFIGKEEIDFQSLLASPPAADSPQLRAELLEIHRLEQTLTAAEIEQTTREAVVSPTVFAQVLGPRFNSAALPRTFNFLHQLMWADAGVVEPIKDFYARKRPYEIDPRLQPRVPLENTSAYPSGHAARLLILASTLSQIFPDHQDALHELAAGIPARRVKAALHFPSDVEAGKILGTYIFNRMFQTRAFQSRLNKAQRECRGSAR